MTYDLSQLMSVAARHDSPPRDIQERILQGIVLSIARQGETLADLPIAELLDEPQKSKLLKYQQSLRRRVEEHFNPDSYLRVAQRAFDMNADALDLACRVVVEKFFPEHIIGPDHFEQFISKELTKNSKYPPIPEALMAVEDAFNAQLPGYQKVHYRIVAGPIFGLPVDEHTKADFEAYKAAFVLQAVQQGMAKWNASGRDSHPDIN